MVCVSRECAFLVTSGHILLRDIARAWHTSLSQLLTPLVSKCPCCKRYCSKINTGLNYMYHYPDVCGRMRFGGRVFFSSWRNPMTTRWIWTAVPRWHRRFIIKVKLFLKSIHWFSSIFLSIISSISFYIFFLNTRKQRKRDIFYYSNFIVQQSINSFLVCFRLLKATSPHAS